MAGDNGMGTLRLSTTVPSSPHPKLTCLEIGPRPDGARCVDAVLMPRFRRVSIG